MVERSTHNGYDVGSSPVRKMHMCKVVNVDKNWPCGGMVDTSYLGFERCRFKSCHGHVTYYSWRVAEWSIAAVLKTVRCNLRGSNPLLPTYYVYILKTYNVFKLRAYIRIVYSSYFLV